MWIPIILVALVFVALSLRLFKSALEAAGAEGWLAGFFLAVGLAMPMRVALTRDFRLTDETEVLIMLVSHGLMTLGLSMYTLFVERVFRPDSGWAGLTTTLLIGLQILAPLAIIFFGGHRDERHPVVLVVGVVRALPFIWGFYESYRYYGRMTKRASLGLADPVVTNRFALFAVWNGALVVLPLLVVVLRVWALYGTESGRMLGGGATAYLILGITRVTLLGLVAAIAAALWLSFFPPQTWLDRVRGRLSDASA